MPFKYQQCTTSSMLTFIDTYVWNALIIIHLCAIKSAIFCVLFHRVKPKLVFSLYHFQFVTWYLDTQDR